MERKKGEKRKGKREKEGGERGKDNIILMPIFDYDR
jgi:hypothetical protein